MLNKIEIGECMLCCEYDKKLIISFEGMVCYQCAEKLDEEEEDE